MFCTLISLRMKCGNRMIWRLISRFYSCNAAQKAFTLAEVLITLLIIGVVSSIAIPIVLNDIKEAEYNEGIKKAYADLSNALKMIQVNNGGTVNVGVIGNTAGSLAITNEFCNVMSCIRVDGTSNIFGPINYKYYKGDEYSSFPGTSSNTPAVIINNGSFVSFRSYDSCNYSGINNCGYIIIDINGKKGPTMLGRDFYYFWIILKNNYYIIAPMGIHGDGKTCLPGENTGDKSSGCTAKRLLDPDNMP